ncbi:MAG: acetyl-CoA C-acyltransferase [Bacteroidia bacterium]
MNEVYIISAVRTPIGSFGGSLSTVSATQLGAAAIKGALAKAGVDFSLVDEVYMGNVCSANLGQAPARQAALFAGLGNNVPCTTVNKVCSSGLKSVMLAAQSIMLGHGDIMVAGGMENMSQVPFYLPNARYGYGYGNGQLIDGLAKDGLTDVYNQQAMGVCADNTAKVHNISREEQDEYAINSYKRVAKATDSGALTDEIVPVEVPQRKGDPILVNQDEEYKKVFFDKIPGLRPAFTKDGTVTAANASTINDGASAIILASQKMVNELGLKPVARILAFADAAQEPEWFTTAPTLATPKALQRAGLTLGDVDYFEVNEAFAVVALAYQKMLEIDANKVNVHGGAVALGHPLGASGARILTTLNGVLHKNSGEIGLAAICNGGGGASAMVIQRM